MARKAIEREGESGGGNGRGGDCERLNRSGIFVAILIVPPFCRAVYSRALKNSQLIGCGVVREKRGYAGGSRP